MGLSRNKVAVSEGAAGSPPFYGECEISLTDISYLQIGKKQTKRGKTTSEACCTAEETGVNCCSILSDREVTKKENDTQTGWGCSSAGRAPALQAGGHGFDSHHLHQRYMREPRK